MSDLKDLPPIPADLAPDLRRALVRLREEAQKLRGFRGDPMDRALTVRDLVDAGIVAVRPGTSGRGGGITPGPATGGGGGGDDDAGQDHVPDLTPPPTPTGLVVSAGISHVFVECDAPLYTQGHGHLRTNVYGAIWPFDQAVAPTFSDAVKVADFAGTVHAFPSNPNTRWCIWIKWESRDGVESVAPAGGTNGAQVTTGQDVTQLLEVLQGKITESELYSALAARIDLIDGADTLAGSVNARLKAEADIRAQALLDEAAARAAAISAEASVRQAADLSLSSQITTLTASVEDNAAAIAAEADARSTALAAEAAARETLAAQLRGAYTGNDLNAVTTGLLYQERIARVAGDNALAQQILLLTAGAGEQFDYQAIWYFDDGTDGWTGSNGGPTASAGWLRPGAGSDPNVVSPAGLGASSTAYPQVKLRIRKVGTPTWEGKLYWRRSGDAVFDDARSESVPEPAYDGNGIAVLTYTPAWDGTIEQIRLDLTASADAGNYVEIDWVAIGRPSPGASTAALAQEQVARATADAALASDISALTATVNDNHSTATAAIAAEAAARAAGDSANATQITALSASIGANSGTDLIPDPWFSVSPTPAFSASTAITVLPSSDASVPAGAPAGRVGRVIAPGAGSGPLFRAKGADPAVSDGQFIVVKPGDVVQASVWVAPVLGETPPSMVEFRVLTRDTPTGAETANVLDSIPGSALASWTQMSVNYRVPDFGVGIVRLHLRAGSAGQFLFALPSAVKGAQPSPAQAFSPLLSWDFEGTLKGWTAGNATLTPVSGAVRWATTASNPYMALNIPVQQRFGGSQATVVRMRARRISGSGPWEGKCYYSTAGHGASDSFHKEIPAPADASAWNVFEWDMAALTAGGADWTSNQITALRIDLTSAAGDTWDVDWIAVGDYRPGPGGADVPRLRADLQVVQQAVVDGDQALASQITTLQSAVGDNTAAIAQEISTRASQTGHLGAYYGLRTEISSGGRTIVGGIGLMGTDAGSEGPRIDFGVRANQFWVAAPSGSGLADIVPFVVNTTTMTINGVSVPPGVYMDAAYIRNGTITGAKIGNAQIDNAKIANVSVVKLTAGALSVGEYIQSTGYVAGSAGWRINGNGTAEFSGVIVRGTIYAAAGQIGGSTIGANFIQSNTYAPNTSGWRLNSDGTGQIGGFIVAADHIRSSNFVQGSAGWRLHRNGNLEAYNGTFRGALQAATGTFAGSLQAATGTFAGSLQAATGTFSGTLTANAVNAVDTINLRGEAVTVPAGAEWTGSSASTGQRAVTPARDFQGQRVVIIASISIQGRSGTSTGWRGLLRLYRDGTIIRTVAIGNFYGTEAANACFVFLDTPPSGSHTYGVGHNWEELPDPSSSVTVDIKMASVVALGVKR